MSRVLGCFPSNKVAPPPPRPVRTRPPPREAPGPGFSPYKAPKPLAEIAVLDCYAEVDKGMGSNRPSSHGEASELLLLSRMTSHSAQEKGSPFTTPTRRPGAGTLSSPWSCGRLQSIHDKNTMEGGASYGPGDSASRTPCCGSVPVTPAPCGPSTPGTSSSSSGSSPSARGRGSNRSMPGGHLADGDDEEEGSIPLEMHLEVTLAVRAWRRIAEDAMTQLQQVEGAATAKILRSSLHEWRQIANMSCLNRHKCHAFQQVACRSALAQSFVGMARQAHLSRGASRTACLALQKAAQTARVLWAFRSLSAHAQPPLVNSAALEKWLAGRVRTAAKRDAFRSLLTHAREAGLCRREASVQHHLSQQRVNPPCVAATPVDATAAKLQELVQRQTRLAGLQEAKIQGLREMCRVTEGLAEQREMQMSQLLKHVEAQEGVIRVLRRGAGAGLGGCEEEHGALGAEERLAMSMRRLEEGLKRSGAKM
mmetsp:Transcript_15421/g.30457  ORF Transcript_15421/g.30457 Transcript_15421/m.30457 type:complete len:480 (-) Transcript_15421:335-1774(-)